MTTNEQSSFVVLNETTDDRRDAIRVDSDGSVHIYAVGSSGRVVLEQEHQIDVDNARLLIAAIRDNWSNIPQSDSTSTIGLGDADGAPETKTVREDSVELVELRKLRVRLSPEAPSKPAPKPKRELGPYPYVAVPLVVVVLSIFEAIPAFIGVFGFYAFDATTLTRLVTAGIWVLPTSLLAVFAGAFLVGRAPKRTTVPLHAGFFAAVIVSWALYSWTGRFAYVLFSTKIPIAVMFGAYVYRRFRNRPLAETRANEIEVFA